MYVLGLDISTSCTGIAILHHSGKLQQLNYVDLSKCNSYWDKVDLFREEMKKIIMGLNGPIQRIFIEESLQRFRSGMSSAKTLSTLTKFNGVASFIAREQTGVILITHKIDEVMTIADKVSVMRSGNLISSTLLESTSKDEIQQNIIGGKLPKPIKRREMRAKKIGLEMQKVIIPGLAYRKKPISLKVHLGEIVGIA